MESITFTFPAEKLRALLPFAADKDIRYYLNGICFQPIDGAIVGITTDGHRLTIVRHAFEHAIPADFSAIVHRDDIAIALKAHGKSPLDLHFAIEPAEREGMPARVKILANGADTIARDTIDGTFPDWRKVIPGMPGAFHPARGRGRNDAPSSGINAAYLGDYAKAAKALGVTASPVIRMRQSHFGASMLVLISGREDFVSVLMPARENPPELPDWIKPAPAANAEIAEPAREVACA